MSIKIPDKGLFESLSYTSPEIKRSFFSTSFWLSISGLSVPGFSLVSILSSIEVEGSGLLVWYPKKPPTTTSIKITAIRKGCWKTAALSFLFGDSHGGLGLFLGMETGLTAVDDGVPVKIRLISWTNFSKRGDGLFNCQSLKSAV